MADARNKPRLDKADIAALTDGPPKLSVVPPGHWRNVYEYPDPTVVLVEASRKAGHEELAPGIWRARGRYITREIAEQNALEYVTACNRAAGKRAVIHLRCEYFPGEAL